MLRHAYYWRMNESADLPVARYVLNWGRPGDEGLVALDDANPVGAAWYRLFPREEAGGGGGRRGGGGRDRGGPGWAGRGRGGKSGGGRGASTGSGGGAGGRRGVDPRPAASEKSCGACASGRRRYCGWHSI